MRGPSGAFLSMVTFWTLNMGKTIAHRVKLSNLSLATIRALPAVVTPAAPVAAEPRCTCAPAPHSRAVRVELTPDGEFITTEADGRPNGNLETPAAVLSLGEPGAAQDGLARGLLAPLLAYTLHCHDVVGPRDPERAGLHDPGQPRRRSPGGSRCSTSTQAGARRRGVPRRGTTGPKRPPMRGLASWTDGALWVFEDRDRPPGQGCHLGRPAAVRGQGLVGYEPPCAGTRSLSPAQLWFRSGSFSRGRGSKCRLRMNWAGLSGL